MCEAEAGESLEPHSGDQPEQHSETSVLKEREGEKEGKKKIILRVVSLTSLIDCLKGERERTQLSMMASNL